MDSFQLIILSAVSHIKREVVMLQYTGYDVGNNLIHVSGILTTLFPSDGGQIRTERTDFVQGE